MWRSSSLEKEACGQPGRQAGQLWAQLWHWVCSAALLGPPCPAQGQALAELNRLELSPCPQADLPYPVPQFPLSEGDVMFRVGVVI